uniref:Myb/SANT-like domain-containing protein n=1 Tax=Spongospora subterranea TaxID=70186 RepID=A0A0H5QSN2_9EUKA|eukprot:CRZ04960.1 hypothetical protein [Spongospora subterranea]
MGADRVRASWTDDMDECWISEMIHQANVLGKKAQSGFKREAWDAAVKILNNRFQINYDREHVKTRSITLKRDFDTVTRIKNLSGFGWDDRRYLATAPTLVWEEYIAAHPRCKKWMTTSMPLFPLLQQLFEDVIANGEFAYSAGARALSDQEDSISPMFP